jgi:transposase
MEWARTLSFEPASIASPVTAPTRSCRNDNLPAHKVAGVREAIAAVGASILYLPPYSPDLNPIEKVQRWNL